MTKIRGIMTSLTAGVLASSIVALFLVQGILFDGPREARAASNPLAPLASTATPPAHGRVLSKPLDMKSGVTEVIPFETGTYVIEVRVRPSDGSTAGVTLSWDGAMCGDQPEHQSHRIVCTVNGNANLSITDAQSSPEATLKGWIEATRIR